MKHIVVISGAGISAESGLKTFRDSNGLWEGHDIMEVATPLGFKNNPELVLEFYNQRRRQLLEVHPNFAHKTISELETNYKVSIITQNVDGLHQQAGVPANRVIELHGNAQYATCLSCKRRYELDLLEKAFREHGYVPDCEQCGGIIKTATISFGQPMPEEEMRLAEELSIECDLFLVLGSSLVVYPAAGLPQTAKTYGAKLAIINEQDTDLDVLFDIKLQMNIGEVLAKAIP